MRYGSSFMLVVAVALVGPQAALAARARRPVTASGAGHVRSLDDIVADEEQADTPYDENAQPKPKAAPTRTPIGANDGEHTVEAAPTRSPVGADEGEHNIEAAPASDSNLDFNLLGAPPVALHANDDAISRRRLMLTLHQGLGISLVGLMAATMVTGQLNYNDRFGGGPGTARFESSHSALAFSTVGTFAATGLLALLAPVPIEKESDGVDRMTLHKIGLFGAAAGMALEAALGVFMVKREGYALQGRLAQAHLGVGYTTLAFMSLGVGALVF